MSVNLLNARDDSYLHHYAPLLLDILGSMLLDVILVSLLCIWV